MEKKDLIVALMAYAIDIDDNVLLTMLAHGWPEVFYEKYGATLVSGKFEYIVGKH